VRSTISPTETSFSHSRLIGYWVLAFGHSPVSTLTLTSTSTSASPWSPVTGDWNLTLKAQLCLSKYLSLFARKFRQMCIQLRTRLHRQARRQLNPALNLNLDLNLCPSLYHALFAKLSETLFEKAFASLFGSSSRQRCLQLSGSACRALCLPRLPPIRSPGRGVGGRIVVREEYATTYR